MCTVLALYGVMKRTLLLLAFTTALLRPLSALAGDAALGVAFSSHAAQVHGEWDFDRRFGVQGDLGQNFSLSAGGRYHLRARKVTPYVGGIYRRFQHHGHDHFGEHHDWHEELAGPTLGLRAREWDGIGAFAQVEALQHVGGEHHHEHAHDHDLHLAFALGVQWWF